MILFKVLTKKFVKDSATQFQNFHVNFHKLHSLFSKRLSQARLSQVLRNVGSELTGAHKTQKMASSLTSLERCYKHDEFLSHMVRVTTDETWLSFVNVKTEERSKQWMHSLLPE
jgi:hypothetical protein